MNDTTPNGPSLEQITELCGLIEAGLPLRLAANSIGVTETTLRGWIQQNPEFEIRIGAAEARFQMQCITAILSACDRKGNPNVRALMWLMESRFPEQYGRKSMRKEAVKASAKGACELQTEVKPELGVSAMISAKSVEIVSPIAPSYSPKPQSATIPKAGRNEPCPCGSGHKYKHCCGATSERARRTDLKTTVSPQALAA